VQWAYHGFFGQKSLARLMVQIKYDRFWYNYQKNPLVKKEWNRKAGKAK
jgi:hypothetical protein